MAFVEDEQGVGRERALDARDGRGAAREADIERGGNDADHAAQSARGVHARVNGGAVMMPRRAIALDGPGFADVRWAPDEDDGAGFAREGRRRCGFFWRSV